MSRNPSHKFLHLLLFVSVCALMTVSAPARLNLENQTSGHRMRPFDHDVPLNSEAQNDATASGDNEAGGEDDAIICEEGTFIQPTSILKQIVSKQVRSFGDHNLDITTPPPRS